LITYFTQFSHATCIGCFPVLVFGYYQVIGKDYMVNPNLPEDKQDIDDIPVEISNCCLAEVVDGDICSNCGEHCHPHEPEEYAE